MDFVTTMFETLQEIVTAVGSLIGNVFESVVNLIYNSSENGGGLTVVGVLLLIGVAVGLFFFVFRWVRGLIRIRG